MTGETLRRVRQSAGLFALLALLALAASLLATGMPRAVNRLTDDALRADVARLPHPARDLMLTTRFDTLLEIPESDVPIDLADGEGRLASYERGLPAPLPGLIGQRWFAASVGPPGVTTIVPSGPRTELGLRVQTGVREASRLTAGRWPASEPGGAAEMAVSETIATKLGLAPGRTLELGGPAGGVVVVVVGIWAPRDAGEPVWDDMPLALDTPWPMPEAPFQAVAVTDPVGLTTAARALRQLRYAWRYRVDERRLDGDLLDRATAAATTARRVPPGNGVLGLPVVTSTGLDSALSRFAAETRAAASLVTVVRTGLLATLFGLVWLAGALAVERRREEFGLLRARGASALRIGGRGAAESLVVVPAAVLAGWYAGTLVPGRAAATGWAVLATGLLAAAVLPVLAMVGQRRPTFVAARRDLSGHRPSIRRLTAELLVLVLGLAGAYLLRRRGLDAAGADGVDAYLTSVPVLLAAGAALVVLRLVPWPLGRAGRLAARGAGAVPFLGLARASRAAPLTVGPVAVLVIAVTTGVFAGAVSSTVEAGRDRAVDREIPADVRLTGFGLPEDMGERLARVPGVSAVTGVAIEPGASVRNLGGQVLFVVVDPASFARVAADSGVDVRLPEPMREATGGGGPVPAVVSADLAREIRGGRGVAELRGHEYEFSVAAATDAFPGLEPDVGRFVALPAPALPDRVVPDRYLIAADGLDEAALRTAVDTAMRAANAAVDPRLIDVAAPVDVTTRAERRAALDRTGANGVLTFTYLVGAVGGAALGLLAVGFAVLAGARPRGLALSRMRTMGLSRRQGRGLLAYELIPLVGVAAVAGGLVGALLPGVLAPALGLAQFTVGEAPRPRLDPLLVGGLLALVATALALAIVVENTLNRRMRLNEVLRLGEEDG